MITALPKVLLLIDTKNWAFATIAQALVTHLSSQFSFDILATEDRPVFDEGQYDIIHVFFETETYHLPFLSGHAKVVKSVYSHYWELNGETPEEFYKKHLGEADCITVPSLKLLRSLSVLPVPVALFPESIDTHLFQPEHKPREGALVVGWAGNATRPIKRLDWLRWIFIIASMLLPVVPVEKVAPVLFWKGCPVAPFLSVLMWGLCKKWWNQESMD
jgi:hypothetical protein